MSKKFAFGMALISGVVAGLTAAVLAPVFADCSGCCDCDDWDDMDDVPIGTKTEPDHSDLPQDGESVEEFNKREWVGIGVDEKDGEKKA